MCAFDVLSRAKKTTKRIEATSDMDGFGSLQPEDQKKLSDIIKGTERHSLSLSLPLSLPLSLSLALPLSVSPTVLVASPRLLPRFVSPLSRWFLLTRHLPSY